MEKFTKIIFADFDGTCLGPMAEAIMNHKTSNCIEVTSRGIVVLFSEPCNPKVYSVLRNHNIPFAESSTRPFKNKDFNFSTVVLVPTFKDKKNTYADYDDAINVYTIKEFVGLEGDIEVPFGQSEVAYEALYKELDELLSMVIKKINII